MAKQAKFTSKNEGAYLGKMPQCAYCKHLTTMGSQEDEDGWSCPAYPEGILWPILFHDWNHEKPLPNQKGTLTFESKEYESDDGPVKYDPETNWWVPVE